MRKYLVIFLFSFLPFFCSAQVSFELGSGAQFYKFKGRLTHPSFNTQIDVDEIQLIFNAVLSSNIPLRYIKDEIVGGVNPGIAVGLFYNSFTLDVPVYATIKLGAGSSKNSSSTLGIGAGVGAMFSYFSVNLPENSASPARYSSAYVVPVIMGEASINPDGWINYQLKVEVTPLPANKFNNEFVGNISQFNIRILRTL